MDKIKLTMNTLFAGIGCQERGIKNSILFDIDVVNISEINKEAVLSYAAIHCGLTPEMVDTYTDYPSREEMARQLTEINLGCDPEKNKPYDWYKLSRRKSSDINKYWLANKLTHNLGDINKIEFLSYADLWTISFPCQSISVAGKMKGLKPDSGTRSSLLWENIRLLKRAKDDGTLPKYLMFENVKNLVSKKFIDDFNNLLGVLDELGFNSYWEVLNAKDCGVPQNRERVFVISIRKDIDKGKFEFPKPFDTGIRLKDIIDRNVDEKYYLSKDIQEQFVLNIEKYDSKNNIGYIPKEQIPTDNTLNDCIQVGDLNHYNYDEMNRVYSKEGCCPTLRTMQGGDRQPRVLEPINPEPDGMCRTIKAQYAKTSKANFEYTGTYEATGVRENFRIRKLTPTECWKLMGLTENDCSKVKAMGIADSQLYKQAGNGIVANCVELLAEHLYKAQYDNTYKCADENFM